MPIQVGSVWVGKSLSMWELRQKLWNMSSTPGRTPQSPSSRHTSLTKVLLPEYSYQDTYMHVPTHAHTMHTHYYKKPITIHIVLHTGVGQCACTTDIKQLWEKMDRVQDNVAANNASSQGKLHVLTFCRRLSTLCRWHDLFTRYILQ